ncbi:hypothetical protein SNE40_008450 [Patella caerulea]|uniref:Adenine phosphoribosyltransferase n=1 Tax=Patella caerulea TaxID=87958 RepID=A0AAN8K866_PATCE
MSTDGRLEAVKALITAHPDFPKKGILFRNIFPVLRDPKGFHTLCDLMVEHIQSKCSNVELIVGLDSRGFLFGPIVAQRLNIGFAPVRKAGKLPGETFKVSYSLEYGQDSFEIEKSSVKLGQKVVIIDDLIATGGSMKAACELIEMAGADVVECYLVIELVDLKGRDKINKPVTSLIQY